MYIPIELDRPRNLRYGFKALSMVEKKLGMPLGKIDYGNMVLDDLAKAIWAGLVDKEKKLTVNKLIDIIDEKDISYIYLIEKFEEAMSAAFPENAAVERTEIEAETETETEK